MSVGSQQGLGWEEPVLVLSLSSILTLDLWFISRSLRFCYLLCKEVVVFIRSPKDPFISLLFIYAAHVFTHAVVYNDAYLFQKSSLSTCYVPGPWRTGKRLVQEGSEDAER